jgi:hypothetical protein
MLLYRISRTQLSPLFIFKYTAKSNVPPSVASHPTRRATRSIRTCHSSMSQAREVKLAWSCSLFPSPSTHWLASEDCHMVIKLSVALLVLLIAARTRSFPANCHTYFTPKLCLLSFLVTLISHSKQGILSWFFDARTSVYFILSYEEVLCICNQYSATNN